MEWLTRLPLPKSAPIAARGAVSHPGSLQDELLEVTVRLRAKPRDTVSEAKRLSCDDGLGRLPFQNRNHFTRAEFRDLFSASQSDVEAVCAFAKRYDLLVVDCFAADRAIQLRGSARDMANAFGTRLELYEYQHGQYRSHTGELLIPVAMLPLVEGVFGLENRPQSKPFCPPRDFQTAASCCTQVISRRYAFPSNLTGRGECIGILAFGGGIALSDLNRYFMQLDGAVPDLRFRNLAPAHQHNLNAQHDKEVALDIEVAGALAPGARIVTYFSTNDQKGWVDALSRAIHDDENEPSVLSISWGATEDWWREDTVATLSQLFKEAATLGITICAASGDDGCAMNAQGQCRVTFPASSPFVLACGGTSVRADGREVVWNVRNRSASGGGISDLHKRPHWQRSLSIDVSSGVPCRRDSNFDGRQLPDVSGPAGYSYNVYVGGSYHCGLTGTSAVAPFWSALVARLNEGLRHRGLASVGHFHPLLYEQRSLQETFRDITSGHNDPFGRSGYEARSGWDSCTGWGIPDGERLLETLQSLPHCP